MEKTKLNLQMFANITTSVLSSEMNTYYSDYLIDIAGPNLVHDQFGQKCNIPEGNSKTICFRKFVPLSMYETSISEGITPNSGNMNVTKVESTLSQYGYYLVLSDVLTLTAVDNVLLEAIELLGKQAGRALDNITREVLCGGFNVMYSGGVWDRADLTEDCKLTVEDIYKAARYLKTQDAPKINGSYVAIIHPDVAYDLMRDPEWIDAHKYAATQELFNGEIGKIAGVRFVESTDAKVFEGSNRNTYGTILLGANAYGVTDIDGGGLEIIVKQSGNGDTSDPLNQRATCGWKALRTATRLVENYMIRIESASTFSSSPN